MTSVQEDLLGRVRKAIDWDKAVGKGGCVLCALSGGPDSVALCDLLRRLGDEIPFTLRAAHLNHGIRGAEADADEAFVREFCNEAGIELEVGGIDVPSVAGETDSSLEMAAREARFQFLAATASRLDCKAIALGHTADDRIEMLFMRLLRGSGGRGLGALQPTRKLKGLLLLRPLLGVFRREIMGYLESRGLSYRIDSSNLTLDTDRNRIRNALLPQFMALAQVHGWESVQESLARSAALIAEDESFLASQAEGHLGAVEIEKGESIRFRREVLGSLPLPILGRLILMAFEDLDPYLRLEREHVIALEEMIKGARSGACDLPGGFRAETEGPHVDVRIPQPQVTDYPEPVEVDLLALPLECEFGPYRVKFSFIDPKEKRTLTSVEPSHVRMNIAPPETCERLLVRVPFRGDRMAPLGMEGHRKKLSDIFVDRKVPRSLRASQPVLVDPRDGEILALPMLGVVSEGAKVTEERTKAVAIEARHVESGAGSGDMVT